MNFDVGVLGMDARMQVVVYRHQSIGTDGII